MSQYVEATVVYRPLDAPRDDGERSERRLFNLDAIRLIVPAGGGQDRSVFIMREGSPGYFTVLEPPEYWMHVLAAWQPRAQDWQRWSAPWHGKLKESSR